MISTNNPEHITASAIREPPVTLRQKLRHLGPGFILSAAIVGSGELVATTTLGAKAGFVTFWVILVSCLAKVALQLEFGKHAIYSGETAMAALSRLPGPRLGKASWPVWTWLLIQLLKLLQMGGIIGGVAISLHIAFPFLPVGIWALLSAISASLLVYRGYYQSVERLSLLMIVLFTLLTFASLFFLQYTSYAISGEDIASGLSFHLPPAAVGVAIAAFGITGVGGDEIMYYNYWCLEKGYARFTGPFHDSPEWQRRAKGWINVMYWDALLSMVLYTLVTAAFYLLGAAILHERGSVPEGYGMIETLSHIYTETLGGWAKSVYLLGAFIILYSTLFVALASWTRIFPDAFDQLGWIDFRRPTVRKKSIAILAWVFPLIWLLLYLFIKLPVLMILLGGFGTSILLLLVVFAAYHFRYRRLPSCLRPSRFYDLCFWISTLVILGVGVYSIITVL